MPFFLVVFFLFIISYDLLSEKNGIYSKQLPFAVHCNISILNMPRYYAYCSFSFLNVQCILLFYSIFNANAIKIIFLSFFLEIHIYSSIEDVCFDLRIISSVYSSSSLQFINSFPINKNIFFVVLWRNNKKDQRHSIAE